MTDAVTFLQTRRSWPPKMLRAPAPEGAALDAILTAGLRVPDHGKLEPWRLVLLGPDARDRLRAPLREAAQVAGLAEADVAKAVSALDSPLIVAVVFVPRPHPRIPEWEQFLSAGNVCLSLVNAALAAGWGAAWLSGLMATDEGFGAAHLGLARGERVAGLIHLGTRGEAPPPERPRPDLASVVTRL